MDEQGEYTATSYKVGIDSPPLSSYMLERTPERIAEITNIIQQFQEQLETNQEVYRQKQVIADVLGQPVKLKVGIILIEFQDVGPYKTNPQGNRPDGYLTADFDSMMFSYNYWYAPNPQFDSPHPENELVFGSFRDYWDQISRGKLKIEGRVVNPTNVNGVPEWLTANGTQSHYLDTVSAWILSLEAYQMALDSNYISTDPADSNYFDHYAVIYAREATNTMRNVGGGGGENGNILYMSERAGILLYLEDKSFTHIGVYAHEFGHNLGFKDEYAGSDGTNNPTDTYNFDLMSWGSYNGPLNKGECTATLSPYWRLQKKWVDTILVSNDQDNLLIEYDYENPKFYSINPTVNTTITEEYYLFETRKRQGFDLYIPGPPSDTVIQPGRLLIWRHNIDSLPPYSIRKDRIMIKPADNTYDQSSQLFDFFPVDFPNNQDLDDMTTPAATLGYIFVQVPLISNERPAHFALHGIQRLENGNILIQKIRLYYKIATHNNAGSWQTVSVPLYTDEAALQSIFPSATMAYHFANGSYIQDTVLSPGIGYFALFPSSTQSLSVGGTPVENLTIPVSNGWTTIGTIFDKIALTNVCTDPPGIIQTIYSYDNGYHYLSEDDSLKPLVGYWVLTNSAGDILIDKDSEGCEVEKVTTVPTIDFTSLDKFTVTDANGFSQSLFVSDIDIDTALSNMNLDLPPMFPEINFDSRFEFNEFVKKVSADSGTIDLNILVQTSSFPVTLSWELNPENGINYSFISDSVQGKLYTIMTKSGDISFASLSDNKIKLWASTDYINPMVELPAEYALQQNYPNPFNPATVINYQIPKAGFVTLKIYDVIGREINTLVNDYQEAGNYNINFDASNLASGIYIYQLKSGEFISTKKMLMLK